ncbi:MAG: ribosome small subunit-dependent GTPase A [Clostridia bacterium]|nr:ribosome small subunit-dependent GTPase A [Clostridia bacterium]
MNVKAFNGIIISGIGGLYRVRPLAGSDISTGEDGTVACRARGVFRHDGISPLPGDSVTCILSDDGGEAVIDEINERKNSLIRPALANLSHLFIVIPATKPKPDLLTADKLVSAAEDKGIEPVIVITKEDLDEDECERIAAIYRLGGFSVFSLSGHTGDGVSELLSYMEKEAESCLCAAFAGVSGAGKSTLMAKLFPGLSLKTGEVSRKIQRGKHTTRHAELYPVTVGESTCFIADTPGFSMLDFARFNFTDREGLPYTFREFAPLMGECRYTKCTHTKEEGCAVLEKVKSNEISKNRHDSYIAMLEEITKNPPWKKKQ